ncbi:MAG: hypothetical protein ACKN81_04280, partial [Pirellulaceae bacterium]
MRSFLRGWAERSRVGRNGWPKVPAQLQGPLQLDRLRMAILAISGKTNQMPSCFSPRSTAGGSWRLGAPDLPFGQSRFGFPAMLKGGADFGEGDW